MVDSSICQAAREKLSIVIVGHVDHGKSTLVGKLLHETGSLPEGRLNAVKAMSEKRGMPFEWAFLMDSFQAERDQGITIDTAQIWFKTVKRDYVIIDAPGHKEFLKNMITGASAAEAALLVIDAKDGMQEQSRRHSYLLHLLGVRQIAVVVNKMDLVSFDEKVFRAVEDDCRKYLADIGITPTFVVPVSARDGELIVFRGNRLSWYNGPSVVEALDRFKVASQPIDEPLRFPIQDIYKFDERRILVGRIETGRISIGDELLFSTSNKTARVKSIEAWGAANPPASATAGQSIGITLQEQLFIERGEIASHLSSPPIETDVFRARIFWLSDKPLEIGAKYKMRLGTSEVPVQVQDIDYVLSTDSLERSAADSIPRNGVAEVVLRTPKLVAIDEFATMARTGRFVLRDNHQTVGGGIISMEGYADQRDLVTVRSTNIHRVRHRVDTEERAARNGHKGGVLWLTGLSGSGKSTLALEVERQMFTRGYQAYVLDGDNIRHGLNANLGFSPADRSENIRRVGEVSALFARMGAVAIAAFISPYRSDRDRARDAADTNFHEIYIKADIATCEARDPKGLYKKARAGEIANFTGISAPYEVPESPDLVIDTSRDSIDACVGQIMDYVVVNLSSTTSQPRLRHGSVT